MMIEPFNISHFYRLDVQPGQRWVASRLDAATLKAIAKTEAFAAITPERVLCCAGLLRVHDGRAVAWALLGNDIAPFLRGIHRATLRLFRLSGYRRIETTVERDFEQGHRWARLLGFEVEAECMAGFGEDGRDHTLYRWGGSD